jgi:hypothetical protein
MYNHSFLPKFSKLWPAHEPCTQFRRLHWPYPGPHNLADMTLPWWLFETTLPECHFKYFWLPHAFILVTKKLFVGLSYRGADKCQTCFSMCIFMFRIFCLKHSCYIYMYCIIISPIVIIKKDIAISKSSLAVACFHPDMAKDFSAPLYCVRNWAEN